MDLVVFLVIAMAASTEDGPSPADRAALEGLLAPERVIACAPVGCSCDPVEQVEGLAALEAICAGAIPQRSRMARAEEKGH
ncbi:MAG: hypothetical protein AAF675_03795 [Pseudomonadota bacterium]